MGLRSGVGISTGRVLAIPAVAKRESLHAQFAPRSGQSSGDGPGNLGNRHRGNRHRGNRHRGLAGPGTDGCLHRRRRRATAPGLWSVLLLSRPGCGRESRRGVPPSLFVRARVHRALPVGRPTVRFDFLRLLSLQCHAPACPSPSRLRSSAAAVRPATTAAATAPRAPVGAARRARAQEPARWAGSAGRQAPAPGASPTSVVGSCGASRSPSR